MEVYCRLFEQCYRTQSPTCGIHEKQRLHSRNGRTSMNIFKNYTHFKQILLVAFSAHSHSYILRPCVPSIILINLTWHKSDRTISCRSSVNRYVLSLLWKVSVKKVIPKRPEPIQQMWHLLVAFREILCCVTKYTGLVHHMVSLKS